MMLPFENVSVIGLGYVGLPTAAVLASRGMQVTGGDISESAGQSVSYSGGTSPSPTPCTKASTRLLCAAPPPPENAPKPGSGWLKTGANQETPCRRRARTAKLHSLDSGRLLADGNPPAPDPLFVMTAAHSP